MQKKSILLNEFVVYISSKKHFNIGCGIKVRASAFHTVDQDSTPQLKKIKKKKINFFLNFGLQLFTKFSSNWSSHLHFRRILHGPRPPTAFLTHSALTDCDHFKLGYVCYKDQSQATNRYTDRHRPKVVSNDLTRKENAKFLKFEIKIFEFQKWTHSFHYFW